MEDKYYNGMKLLSLRDKNGAQPELYLLSGNRTAGKTTWFNAYLVRKFIKTGKPFILLNRYGYENENVHERFFNDIKDLFFPEWIMHSKTKNKGLYTEIYIAKDVPNGSEPDWELCGYSIDLNHSEKLKKVSHLFSKCWCVLFDEFQSEQNDYVPNEIDKFLSIQKTVARGQGEQKRYVPFFLISNNVSLINPYYSALGISYLIQENTKFLRGEGFVVEICMNESAKKAQEESAFAKAFKGNKYNNYASSNIYLNDSKAFINEPEGRKYYVCTFVSHETYFGVFACPDSGVFYCTTAHDCSYPVKIAVDVESHTSATALTGRGLMMINRLRQAFEQGIFRFKNLDCKKVVLTALSY